MSIHQRIKDLRLNLKMSQQDVAGLVGVSWQTIQQWENGSTAPNRTRLPLAAKALQTTVNYLVTGIDSQDTEDDSELSLIAMLDTKLSAGTGSIVFEMDGSRKIAFRTEYLRNRRIKPENAFGFPVEGDSMIDVGIPDGGMVALNSAIKEPRNRKFYGMWIDDRYLVKEIVKRSDGFYAVSHNEAKKDKYPDKLIDSENSGIIGQVFYCGFEL